jgi:hypothetical protein
MNDVKKIAKRTYFKDMRSQNWTSNIVRLLLISEENIRFHERLTLRPAQALSFGKFQIRYNGLSQSTGFNSTAIIMLLLAACLNNLGFVTLLIISRYWRGSIVCY